MPTSDRGLDEPRGADFVRSVPVHWNDCDPARIVFHAHYVGWMDEGFHELCRARGLDFATLVAADASFRGSPLVNIACGFRLPAMYGDLLEHRIHPAEFGAGKSFVVKHSYLKAGAVVATGEQVRIWGYADASGTLRAVPVPPDVRAKLRGEQP